MLKAGYLGGGISLFAPPAGRDHYPRHRLWDAIIAAAAASGIGLTLLPTLYTRRIFGAAPLHPKQARFASDTDWFLRGVEHASAQSVARRRRRCAPVPHP